MLTCSTNQFQNPKSQAIRSRGRVFELQEQGRDLMWRPIDPRCPFHCDAAGRFPLRCAASTLPTATPSSASSQPPPEFPIPSLWQWAPASRWRVDSVDGGGDGWAYAVAVTAPALAWTSRSERGKGHRYRRRCWVRPVVALPQAVALLEAATAASGALANGLSTPATASVGATAAPPLLRIPCVSFAPVHHWMAVIHGVGAHGHNSMKKKVRV